MKDDFVKKRRVKLVKYGFHSAFYSSPSKKVLAKLARYLKEVDWSEMKKECPQNSTLAEYWSQTKR